MLCFPKPHNQVNFGAKAWKEMIFGNGSEWGLVTVKHDSDMGLLEEKLEDNKDQNTG